LSSELTLIERGYKRIALIGGKPDDMISWHRLRGARQAFEEACAAIPNAYVKQGDSTPASGSRLTKQLLKTDPAPDAILCANNLIALGCLQALRESGRAIPADVALMTFDSYPFAALGEFALTVVDINMFHMGEQAARFILEKISRANLTTQTFSTLPELVVRGTT
jgi:DNA-binding LacI/PurR family transcriptional regulator